MNWFLMVVKTKYADFKGRAQRTEYWYFMLFYTQAYIAMIISDVMLGTISQATGIGLLSELFSLAILALIPFSGLVLLFLSLAQSTAPSAPGV